MPKSTFELDFPPGTFVQNTISGKKYIVRENEGDRPVKDFELRSDGPFASMDELAASPPSDGLAGGRRVGWRWFVLLNVALLVVLAASVLAYRVWNRKRSQ